MRHRKALVFVVLAVTVYAGYQAWSAVTASHKISEEVKQLTARQDRINVEVVLPFAPEMFHLNYFQRLGNVTGVHDNRIRIMQIAPEKVRRIARLYWVERIDLVK